MFLRLFHVAIAFCVFSGTLQRNLGPRELREINDILRSVDNADSYDDQEDTYKVTPDSPNDDVIGLKEFNSYLNRLTNLGYQDKFDDDDFEIFLRKQNEERCQKIGRCGCGLDAGRCGDSTNYQKTVNDVTNFLDNLEKKLNRENRLGNSKDPDKSSEMTGPSDLMGIENNKEINDRLQSVQGDKIPKTNHIDVVVVSDIADIDEVLRDNGLVKLGLKDLNNADLEDISRHEASYKLRDNVKAIIVDLDKFYNDSGNKNNELPFERSINHRDEQMSPDHFFHHFNTLKNKVTKDLVDYVTNKKVNKPNLSLMNNTQKRKIRILKGKMRLNKQKKTERDVKSDVNNILFGKSSNVKVVPSDTDPHNILVPSWMYKLLLNTKPEKLRSPKRVLPLTTNQRNRLISQNSSPSPLISRIWRRSFAQNMQRYGLPFQLAVQGLAQYNDYD